MYIVGVIFSRKKDMALWSSVKPIGATYGRLHHMWNNENSWKITKDYFYRDCATIHYMMFEYNPLGLAILWTCLRAYKESQSISDDFCFFWSIYPPNKQKIAQNSTFWSTKTLFCVIYKKCSLWYVKITFWAQNLPKLSQKPFWDFENYSKMSS